MLNSVREFVMRVLALTAWHEAVDDGRFYWRRWRDGRWESREMTPDELDRGLNDWAIK
ncbi:hypothetical protein QN219_25500 [Sinorhizobium sp. 7-81]|uniref:hypothetical protein n=1 Tax=Sinorhizobium sp. 8-89 TaxID=3049089 RepID=UPI0024C258BA|nr:hypothetical protein [Sinorhizobium sp. 8-89]MDK1493363.1 hypothetical protein [Sinorhizobium sp. 8-89]